MNVALKEWSLVKSFNVLQGLIFELFSKKKNTVNFNE